jgi:hypothetical protein
MGAKMTMNRSSHPKPERTPAAFGVHALGCLAGISLALILVGCSRNDIQVYRVSKETTPAASTKLPEGWQEVAPGEMRFASFRVSGKDGKSADVGIFPLPGMAASDLANVNRWRGQVGQPEITEAELSKVAEPVQIAGQPGQLFDQAGTNPSSGDRSRILAAILRREGTPWFFKMTGDDELVAQQKSTFIEFLKSYSFDRTPAASSTGSDQPQLPPSHPPISGASAALPPGAADSSNEKKPDWQVPAGWKEVAPGPMVMTRFQLGGAGQGQTFVTVSSLGGDGGGLAANVNRWRSQLGLTPLGSDELNKQIQTLDVANGKAMLIEMIGTDARTQQKARLFGVVVPQDKQTWFYKLMGDEKVVEREKDAFTKFVQNTKYN